MNLILTRDRRGLYGIVGTLRDESGNKVCITLEHAFQQPGGTFSPKVVAGTYNCVRGQHRLAGKTSSFETFMLMDVPPFMSCQVSGILFHRGNYNGDSEGCILLGESLGTGCILESNIAFGHFLDLQVGCDNFEINIIG